MIKRVKGTELFPAGFSRKAGKKIAILKWSLTMKSLLAFVCAVCAVSFTASAFALDACENTKSPKPKFHTH